MEKYKVLGGRVPAGSQWRTVVQVEARSERRNNIMTVRRNIPSLRRLFLKTRVVETKKPDTESDGGDREGVLCEAILMAAGLIQLPAMLASVVGVCATKTPSSVDCGCATV
eukprot:scaffold3249_cov37-Cyclotella_meneghiniana.AAC.1